MKFTSDGAIASRTAYLSEPYVGRPDDHGIEYMNQEAIFDAVDDAHANHFRISIYANGDIPITNVLNAYERALERDPRPDHRYRIEHCTLVNPEILARIKALGVIRPHSTPTCVGTATKWRSMARRDWNGCSRTALFWTTGSPWRLPPITVRVHMSP